MVEEAHLATTIDEYLASLPAERRVEMERLRKAIRSGAPEAVEAIAYRMPAFRSHDGQFLVSFDAFKRQYSLFPASEAVVAELGAALAPYLSGKGTIRFPVDRPVPVALVEQIARIRFAENAARAARITTTPAVRDRSGLKGPG
jgi:uncharacterized protein YdhG (YjbR/CyaY superfamily)